MNTTTSQWLALAGAIVCCAVAQAGEGNAPPASKAARHPATAIRPMASFQEIMLAEVNPAASFVWNAVSTESTASGTIEHRPNSEQDWLAVRHQALVLIEAGNLLLIEGRPIVARGATVKDAEQPGILGPEQIRRAMDADRAGLVRLVHALQDATQKVIEATDARDADALSEAGGNIDEACEACHKAYWYPAPKRPVGATTR
jgi:hypothetical protein